MNLKIDTKEKFHQIRIEETHITANMAEKINALDNYLKNSVQNVILQLAAVALIDISAAEAIVSLQQRFYDNNASLVICELQPSVEKSLDEAQLLEAMNVVPTLSEAWDIVQMEEIERELLGDEE